MEIKKIGVIGAGTMGHGIALTAAQIGCQVVLRDIEDKFVQN
ncbi:MAG: 3-hydroxybutyryl-CoA dehydrogenase, partial [Deltaproteobacteria bacterium]|nr:3-hydroxybutyryl-CoA dehydrogenase [Deltaproteobacteria bacterium]